MFRYRVVTSDHLTTPVHNVVLIGDDVSPQVDAGVLFSTLLNFGINPILYFALQGDFRRSLMDLVPCFPGSERKTGLELGTLEPVVHRKRIASRRILDPTG